MLMPIPLSTVYTSDVPCTGVPKNYIVFSGDHAFRVFVAADVRHR